MSLLKSRTDILLYANKRIYDHNDGSKNADACCVRECVSDVSVWMMDDACEVKIKMLMMAPICMILRHVSQI